MTQRLKYPTTQRLNDTTTQRRNDTMTLIAVGDMMLGRDVAKTMAEKGEDFIFSEIKETLADSDTLFGVLDSPVSLKGIPNPDKPKGFPKLRCRPEAVDALKKAGFSVIHIGTNHILDFGEEGLKETVNLLDKKGIKHIGAGKNLEEARRPVIIEKNGLKLGFLGYCLSYPASKKNAGCAPLKLELILEDIKNLKSSVDHVIVSIHHGIEYSSYPYPEYMDMVHKIVDAGANVVLGHHPHSVQGYERYKGAYIIYSLGNFIFDKDDKLRDVNGVSKIRLELEEREIVSRPGSEKFYEGMILKIALQRDGIKGIKHLPILINNEFQPVLADEKQKQRILTYFEYISANLNKKELGFFKQLSELYAEENVQLFLKKSITQAIAKFYRLRPRHLRQFFMYLQAKAQNVR